MVLDDSREGRLVIDVADPAGQLRVPKQGMAANRFVVLLGEVDERIAAAVAELAPARLGRIPFH
jgi:hypothetical protein